MSIGSTGAIDNGAAAINYVTNAAQALSITAEYSGNGNNTGAVSSVCTVGVLKKMPNLSIVEASPVSPQDYPVSVTLSSSISNCYPSLEGKCVTFFEGGGYLGTAITDSTGVARIILPNPNAGTHDLRAEFAGDMNNYSAVSGSLSYTVNKGTQNGLIIDGIPSQVTYGDSPFELYPYGGSVAADNYTFSSSDKNVLSVDENGIVTVISPGTAIITVTKAGDENYNDISKDVTISVAKKALHASITPNDKQYDRTAAAAVKEIQYYGIVGSDDAYITGGALEFNDKTADDNKEVEASGYVLSGTKASYYSLMPITVYRASIRPVPLTITNTAVKNKAYDGTPAAEFAGSPALSGVLKGDSVILNNGVPAFTGINYSPSEILVVFTDFSISGGDAGNYTLTQPDPVWAYITRKTLNVSVEPVTIRCGQAIPGLKVDVTGFAPGEDENSIVNFIKPTASQSYGSTTTAVNNAPMAVTYSGGYSTYNYEFSFENTTRLTIDAVPVKTGDYHVSGAYSTTADPTGWNTGDFTITPANGYDLISTDGTTWLPYITVNTEAYNGTTVFQLKKSSDGTKTENAMVYYSLDKTHPAGTISIRNNIFKSFMNAVTFGLYYKDRVDVSIKGTDSLSGIKSIEYQKVAKESDFDENGTWTPGSPSGISFSILPSEQFIIYAKIIDNAGNAAIINSNGMVVYTDSALTAPTVYFDNDTTRKGYADVPVIMNLNNNTLNTITYGEYTLIKGTDYTVDGSTVTLKKDYLKTIVHGKVAISFSFNPMGKAFGTGDTPENAQLSIIELIHAAVPVFTVNLSGSAAYKKGNAADTLTVNAAAPDNGEITYQWYVSREKAANGTAIEGATGTSFTPDTGKTGVYYYYAAATNTNNSVTGDKTASAVSNFYMVKVSHVEVLPPVVQDGSPAAALQGDSNAIIDAVLTDGDQKKLADGSDISISLKVEKTGVPPSDQNLMLAALDGKTLGEYLSLSLIKNIDGTRTTVTKTSKPIRITINIPENLRSGNRIFSIICVQDSTAATLSDLDSDPNTITIETDRFSTCAIVYTEKKSGEAAPTPGTSTTETKTSTPNAGNHFPTALLALIGLTSLSAVLYIIIRHRYKMKKK
jgi:Domain of unknown function.